MSSIRFFEYEFEHATNCENSHSSTFVLKDIFFPFFSFPFLSFASFFHFFLFHLPKLIIIIINTMFSSSLIVIKKSTRQIWPILSSRIVLPTRRKWLTVKRQVSWHESAARWIRVAYPKMFTPPRVYFEKSVELRMHSKLWFSMRISQFQFESQKTKRIQTDQHIGPIVPPNNQEKVIIAIEHDCVHRRRCQPGSCSRSRKSNLVITWSAQVKVNHSVGKVKGDFGNQVIRRVRTWPNKQSERERLSRDWAENGRKAKSNWPSSFARWWPTEIDWWPGVSSQVWRCANCSRPLQPRAA